MIENDSMHLQSVFAQSSVCHKKAKKKKKKRSPVVHIWCLWCIWQGTQCLVQVVPLPHYYTHLLLRDHFLDKLEGHLSKEGLLNQHQPNKLELNGIKKLSQQKLIFLFFLLFYVLKLHDYSNTAQLSAIYFCFSFLFLLVAIDYFLRPVHVTLNSWSNVWL